MNIKEAKQVVRHARHRQASGLTVGVDQLIEAARVLSEKANVEYYRVRDANFERIIRANRRPTADEVRERLTMTGEIEVHVWNGEPPIWNLT